MKIPISSRLLACADFVPQGSRVADIGCDHGYLSIYLLTRGIAASAITSDVREGPLRSAMTNAQRFGIEENIRFYLSDGFRAIPRDFDCAVCAGMGADTMISILEAAPWLRKDDYRLILQCQSKTPMLRRYLSDNGWHIRRETALRDGRFLYTVMEVLWQPDAPRLTLGQWYFPPAMTAEPSEFTEEYFRQTLDKLQYAIQNRGDSADPEHIAALSQLQQHPIALGRSL